MTTIKIIVSLLINFFHNYVVNFSVSLQIYFLVFFLLKFYTGFYYTGLAVSLNTPIFLYLFVYFLAYSIYGLYSFSRFSVRLEQFSGLSKKDYRSKKFYFYTFASTMAGYPLRDVLITVFMLFFSKNITRPSVFIKVLSAITFLNSALSVILFQDWFLLKLWVCLFSGFKLIDMGIQLVYRSEDGSKLLYKITHYTGTAYLDQPKFYLKDGKYSNVKVPGSQLVLTLTGPLFGIKSYLRIVTVDVFITSVILELFYLVGLYPGSFLRVLFYSLSSLIGF